MSKFLRVFIISSIAFSFLMYSKLFSINDLRQAIKAGDIELIKNIVKNNPNLINTKDNEGKTAVHHAAMLNMDYSDLDSFLKSRANIIKIIRLLMEHGANIDMTDNHGKIAIEYALEKENIITAGPLLHFDIDGSNNSATLLFFIKNMQKYFSSIKDMINKLTDIKSRTVYDSFEYCISCELLMFSEKYLEFIKLSETCDNYDGLYLIIRYARLTIFDSFPESLSELKHSLEPDRPDTNYVYGCCCEKEEDAELFKDIVLGNTEYQTVY